MPLCLLALIGLPLFLSLGASHARLQELHALESDLIALDNAAIRLGQSARAVWNDLQKANAVLRSLEVRHHLLHVCARVPATAVSCQAGDRAIEAALTAAHAQALASAVALWHEGMFRARAQAPEARFTRPGRPPVRAVRCLTCRLPTGWEIEPPRSESIIYRGARLRVHWVGGSLRGGEPWNYSIEENDHG